MTSDHRSDLAAAHALAQQAEQLIGKNKLGMWDSINALSLASIARSLAVLAETSVERSRG